MRIRLVFLFMFFSIFLGAQSILEQEITFKVKNLPVKETLIRLSEQANINISFSGDIFANNNPISINTKASIKKILDRCLKHQSIIYKISGNGIILIPKPAKNYTLSGYIEDKDSGERLIGAYIIDSQTGLGSTTNEYGFFSLTLAKGTYKLLVSYVGYNEKVQNIDLHQNTTLSLQLDPDNTLREVIVEAKRGDSITFAPFSYPEKKQEELNHKSFSSGASLGGESDLLQITYLKPGVQTGVGGFGGLHVRGGHEDQNLILMDGVTVYNPSHSLGLISIFNASAINQVSFIKSGFSAKYGGRLSSVLDVRTKEGNINAFQGEIQTGTFASRLTLQGPILPGKAGFFVSVRRTHWDPLIKRISRLVKGTNRGFANYEFYDINAKVHWKIKDNDKIYYSYYLGGDKYVNENTNDRTELDSNNVMVGIAEYDRTDITWGNTIQSLRWNHQYGSKMFSNMTAVYSRYNYTNYNGSEYLQTDPVTAEVSDFFSSYSYLENKIQEMGAKIDFDYIPNPNRSFSFGASFNQKIFAPGIVILENFITEESPKQELRDSLLVDKIRSNEMVLYFQSQLQYKKFSIGAGLYHSIYVNEQKPYISFEPRLDITYWMSSRSQLRLTATKMTQNIHLLSNEGVSLPNDLWVPSTKRVHPQKAWQSSLGWHWNLNKRYSLTVETYYKYLKDVIAFRERIENPQIANIVNPDWEDEVIRGNGHSYGLETIFQKKEGNSTGWISYTLSKSIRIYPDLNSGIAFPYSFDRKHLIQIVYKQKFNKKVSFSANWIYGTGRPITLIAARVFSFSQNNDTVVLSKINDHRLPDYHKINIGFDFTFDKKWGGQKFSLGFYNAYNHRNVLYEFYEKDINGDISNSLVEIPFLPIFPTISYSIHFEKKMNTK